LNRKAIFLDAGAFIGAGGLVLASWLAASTITGLRSDRDTYRAEASRPRATTTRVVTEPPAATPTRPERNHGTGSASPPGSSTARPEGEPEQGGGGYTVTSAREPSAPRPGAGAPSGPRPSAPPASTAPRCLLGVTAASLGACVRIGR
jgi:hypothetical protein